MCEISQGRGYCVFTKHFDALMNWSTHSLYRQISIIVSCVKRLFLKCSLVLLAQPVSHQNHFILFLSHALNAEGGKKAGGHSLGRPSPPTEL